MSETKEAFDVLADDYSEIRAQNWDGMRMFAHRNVILGDDLGRVLDIGNGGATPEEMLLPTQIERMKMFVGMDHSRSMLQRNNYRHRVAGDGFAPPFKKGSFDTVMVWECLHHLGLTGSPESRKKLDLFLARVGELVAPDGYLYIIEPTFPSWLEWIERVVFRSLFALLGKSGTPTKAYIFSSRIIKEALTRRFDCEYLKRVPMHRFLGGRMKLYTPMIFLSWFKLPVGLMPSGVLYCRVRPRPEKEGGTGEAE